MKENKLKKKGKTFNTSLSKLSKEKPKKNMISKETKLNLKFFRNFTLKKLLFI